MIVPSMVSSASGQLCYQVSGVTRPMVNTHPVIGESKAQLLHCRFSY